MYRTLRCDPKLFEKNLSDKTYLLTGANSGIGLATTKQLVSQGAHVIMACRRLEAGHEAEEAMKDMKGSVDVVKLDLSDLVSVRNCADFVINRYDRLDGLVNNAGIYTFDKEVSYTKAGHERMFGTNHLGHFLLTELLLDLLIKSSPARIVSLSSLGHTGNKKKRIDLDFEDLNYKTRDYDNNQAYGESKLANLLYTKELADRLKGTGVIAMSTHPGWVRSNLAGDTLTGWVMNNLLVPIGPLLTLVSSEDGAQPSLHCLLDDQVVNHSGEYFSQSTLFYPDRECRKGGWPMQSPNPNARDLSKAKKLVEVSRGMVGLE